MIVWLPEKLYRRLVEDKEFYSTLRLTEKQAWSYRDNLVGFHNYVNWDGAYDTFNTVINDKMTDAEKQLYNIVRQDPKPELVKEFLQIANTASDPDIRMMALYWAESSYPSKNSPEYYKTVCRFVADVEASDDFLFCERIYVKWFQYRAYLYEREVLENKDMSPSQMLRSYLEHLEKFFDEAKAKYPGPYLEEILKHKALYESMCFMRNLCGVFGSTMKQEEVRECHATVQRLSHQYKFKYSGSSLPELLHLYTLFQMSVIRNEIDDAVMVLEKIKWKINQAFTNREKQFKCLLHHNLDGTEEFMLFCALIWYTEWVFPELETITKIDFSRMMPDEEAVIKGGNFYLLRGFKPDDDSDRIFSARKAVLDKALFPKQD